MPQLIGLNPSVMDNYASAYWPESLRDGDPRPPQLYSDSPKICLGDYTTSSGQVVCVIRAGVAANLTVGAIRSHGIQSPNYLNMLPESGDHGQKSGRGRDTVSTPSGLSRPWTPPASGPHGPPRPVPTEGRKEGPTRG